MNPQDWKPVLQDSFHPPSAFDLVVRDTLGADSATHRSFERSVPGWRWPLWASAFEALTAKDADTRWKVEKLFGDNFRGQPGPPRFGTIQVGPGQTQTAISEACAVMRDVQDDRQFLLRVSSAMGGGKHVDVVAKDDQRVQVEDFYRSLADWMRENNFFKGQKIDPRGRFLELDDVDEADLILPEPLKGDLFRNVATMIERAPEYAKYGLPAKRGVILAGPPGNGKTLSMKVLAKKLDCTFLWCTPKHVQELDGLAHIYEFARELAPTVVLLEDADAFGIDRRMGQFNPMLGELLQHLDGMVSNQGVVTILSSNYAEVLDSALTRRPGRFDVKLKFNEPDGDRAWEMIRRTLERRKAVYQGAPEFLRALGHELAKHRASGAHVVETVNYASMLAVERGQHGEQLLLTQPDFEQSAQRVIAGLALDDHTEKALIQEGVMKWGFWGNSSGE
jgi:hypothetical protein